MNRRTIGWLFLALTVLCGLTGCSGHSRPKTTPPSSSNELKAQPNIKIAYFSSNGVPRDLSLVEAEVNNITRAKIGADVELLPYSYGDYAQKTNLMLSSDEGIDLMVTASWMDYPSLAARGWLLPLDGLIDQHAPKLREILEPDYLAAASIKGKIYGIPSLRDMAGAYGITMRKDLVEKYKIDLSRIISWKMLKRY